jgi:hypothetical protein
VALRLFDRAVQRRLRIRRLVLRGARLHAPIGQLALFPWDDSACAKESKLLQSIDHIRQRYGTQAIYYGKASVVRNGECGRRKD